MLRLKLDNDSITTQAYHGLCEAMLADYQFWPFDKIMYFNRGKAKIERAINTKPTNPELRYIRLMVQLNAPAFLSYDKEVSIDLNYLDENLLTWTLSKTWSKAFIQELIQTKYIRNTQIDRLQKLSDRVNDLD